MVEKEAGVGTGDEKPMNKRETERARHSPGGQGVGDEAGNERLSDDRTAVRREGGVGDLANSGTEGPSGTQTGPVPPEGSPPRRGNSYRRAVTAADLNWAWSDLAYPWPCLLST